MTILPRYTFAVLLLLLPQLAAAADRSEYPRPELLLEPGELAQSEAARTFIILDVRPAEAYQQAHIPGAQWVDHDAWSSAFYQQQDAGYWSRRIGQLGIDRDAAVVVYGDDRMRDAARICWILRYWGVDDARMLHGGWQGWKAEALPTTNEPTARPQPVAFEAQPREERLDTKDSLLESLQEDRIQVVDARSEDEHCGIDQRASRSGSILGARHLEWSDLIDSETHRFKSPDTLQRLFDEAGIDLKRPTASHCQSGGRAALMALGLELMGAENVSNYYRGWSEWGEDSQTPIDPEGSARPRED